MSKPDLTFKEIYNGWKPNPLINCRFCETRGQVIVRKVERKAGVSGGKATGAVLTGGLSLLATGLSRKVKVTELKCKNCNSEWTVE